MVPEAARRHHVRQQALAAATTAAARRLWGNVDWADLDGSWGRVAQRMFVLVALSQRAAAAAADPYVTDALTETNVEADAEGSVAAAAFAGVASDGRDLDSLLYEPVIAVKSTVSEGQQVAMGRGLASLARIVSQQVQDAGRSAVGAAITARPAVTGYVRMLSPPSCSRCAILAGAFYKWNTGFHRHPFATAGMCRRQRTSQATSPPTRSSISSRCPRPSRTATSPTRAHRPSVTERTSAKSSTPAAA